MLALDDKAAAEESAMRPLQAPVGAYAPAGERTFEQAYNLRLRLPMPEAAFIALVEKLGLKFGGQAPPSVAVRNREPGGGPDHPLLVNYDMTNISHSYVIYPGVSPIKTIYYLALVNREHLVVYIETQADFAGILP